MNPRAAFVIALSLSVSSAALADDKADCFTNFEQLLDSDPTRAAEACQRLAEGGNVTAQNNLGFLYGSGLGVGPDLEKAATWFRQAAEAGHVSAQHNLGFLYEKGIGLKQDEKEAAIWYRKAARGGYAPAQINLGSLYQDGRGVTKDPVKAYAWYAVAATRLAGDEQIAAQGNRDLVAQTMSPEQIGQAERLAGKLLKDQPE
jgi:hypothetical protein